MRIRIGKLELKIPWEYLAALLIILLALTILLVWKANHERGETIRIMSEQTPLAAGKPSGTSMPYDDDSYYDVPDVDDEESKPGREPPGTLRVNINKAGMDELVALPYIGEVKARAVIEYREEHGPFNSIEDLLNVKGIGPKTLERIRDYIVLE
ncbi:MAG TPA: helix-hairpin-helix domain-containing protein [Thermoclostridium sp.]|nr:helix-hairpin-helix domain-containing protein [Clostridiaceae bacterium]HOQ75083.1 helix-hairpin-helix domain-containing protein [Thermoclostridium sp.]HPU44969.1 helix-hairpin-helix domain-containing protein [Thermoclostridium sp.]